MVMKVTFEAITARELFRQLADFIEVGAGTTPTPKAKAAPVPAPKASECLPPKIPESLEPAPAPTPAVVALLKELNVGETDWVDIPRTGKGQRMTQKDVKGYASGRIPGRTEATFVGAPNTEVTTHTFDPKTEEVKASEQEDVKKLTDESADVHTGEVIPAATLDEAKAAMQALYVHKNGGREVCLVLLSRFGVKRLSDVPEDQLGRWTDLCRKTVAGEHNPQGSSDA